MYTHQRKIKDETKYLRDNVQIISEAIAKLHGKVDSIIDSISHMKMTNDVKKGEGRSKNKKEQVTITPGSEIVPYVPYEEGSARGSLLRICPLGKKWDAKCKYDHIAT